MFKRLLLLSVTLLIQYIGYSQDKFDNLGWSTELGIGYNTLSWDVDSYLTGEHTTYDRNNFFLLPSLKVKYANSLSEFEKIDLNLSSFIGYNMFGGKSKTDQNGYKDIIIFQSIEGGILPTLDLKNRISFFGGIKGQYILSAKSISYGSDQKNKEWEINEIKKYFFKNFSFSAGVGMNYHFKKFIIGFESWFGLNNLSTINDSDFYIHNYENNYRLILGYKFE